MEIRVDDLSGDQVKALIAEHLLEWQQIRRLRVYML